MKLKLLETLRYGTVLGAICLLIPATALAADENHGQLSSSDYKFMREADLGGMAEVQLGQIAKDRATDPAVKQFAEKMVNDHTQANQQLSQLASQKGATLPTEIPASERRETDHLLKLSGPEFDRAYMKHMVSDHKTDVKAFEHAAKKSSDPDVQAWAAKTLPTLQEHLQMAKQVDSNVKNESSSTIQ
jgi:putative membrane protein